MNRLKILLGQHTDVVLVLAVLGVLVVLFVPIARPLLDFLVLANFSFAFLMMPPTTVALPLKVLMFVLVDGWALILKALVGSFH
jgi:flagellar biosynthesis protein FliP